MKRLSLIVALVVFATGCGGTRPASRDGGRCAHTRTERNVRGAVLCEDAFGCERPPYGAFDRVSVRRVANCTGAQGPVVVYLPGSYMHGEIPAGELRHDFRLHLAAAGIRVWSVDYRTHAVPPTTTGEALAPLGAWSASVFTDDVQWALGFVRTNDPGSIVLAGFSYGAGLAYRIASTGTPLAGLVILDGAAGTGRPVENVGPALDVGSTRLPYDLRRRLLAAVIANPRSPSPLPGFATARDALADVLWTSRAFGGNGGLSALEKGVSSPQVVARLLQSYDRWWPSAALDGGVPSPPSTPIPVLAFTSTNIGPEWVARVRQSAEAFGGPQAQVRELPGFGHIDVLVGMQAPRLVWEPIRQWVAGRGL